MATSPNEVDLLEDGELPSSDEEEVENNSDAQVTADVKLPLESAQDEAHNVITCDVERKQKRPFESPSPPNTPLKNNKEEENENAKKKPKMDELSNGEEGEIFSDDEEAAYYPQLVKKRDDSSNYDKSDSSPSKGSYLQDDRYSDRDGHTPQKGNRYGRGWWRDSDRRGGRSFKSHGDLIGPPIRHDRVNDKKWEEPRNSYTTPTLTLEILESRLSRHLALLPTPQISQCTSLDEMNYPAPPQWYMRAVTAYNRKRQKEREEIVQHGVVGERRGEGEEGEKSGDDYGEEIGSGPDKVGYNYIHQPPPPINQPVQPVHVPLQPPSVIDHQAPSIDHVHPPIDYQPVQPIVHQPIVHPPIDRQPVQVPNNQPIVHSPIDRQPVHVPQQPILHPPIEHQHIPRPEHIRPPVIHPHPPIARPPIIHEPPIGHHQPIRHQPPIYPVAALQPVHLQPVPIGAHIVPLIPIHESQPLSHLQAHRSSNDFIPPPSIPPLFAPNEITPVPIMQSATPTHSSHTEVHTEVGPSPSELSKNSNDSSKNSNITSSITSKNSNDTSKNSNDALKNDSCVPEKRSSLKVTPLLGSNKQHLKLRKKTVVKTNTATSLHKKNKRGNQKSSDLSSLIVSINLSLISSLRGEERGKESEDDYDNYLDQLNDEEESHDFDDNLLSSNDFWIDTKPSLEGGDPLEEDFPLLGDQKGVALGEASKGKRSLRSLVSEQSIDDNIEMTERKRKETKQSKKKGLAGMRIPRKKKPISPNTTTTNTANAIEKKESTSIVADTVHQLTQHHGSDTTCNSTVEQDSSKPCKYFISGHCIHGDNCQFSHSFKREKKKEMCKFYLQDACDKGEDCLFHHGDFPCKYFHTRHMCYHGDSCKFSHAPLNDESYDILMHVLEPSMKEFVRYPPIQPHPLEAMPSADMRPHPSSYGPNFNPLPAEVTPINKPVLRANVRLSPDFDVTQLFPDEHPQVLPHQLATQLRKVLLTTPTNTEDNKTKDEQEFELEYWESEDIVTKQSIPPFPPQDKAIPTHTQNDTLHHYQNIDDPRRLHPHPQPIIPSEMPSFMPCPPPPSVLHHPLPPPPPPIVNRAPMRAPPPHRIPHQYTTDNNTNILPPMRGRGPPGGSEILSDPRAVDPRHSNRHDDRSNHASQITNSTHPPLIKDSSSPSHWSSNNGGNSNIATSAASSVGRSAVQVRQKYSQFKIKPKNSSESILKKTSEENNARSDKNLPLLLKDSTSIGKPLAPNELFGGGKTTPTKDDAKNITMFGSRQQVPDSPSFGNEMFGEIKMISDEEENNSKVGMAIMGGTKQGDTNSVPSYLTHLGLGQEDEVLQIDSAFGSLQARQRRLSEISSVISEDTTSQLSNPAHPTTPPSSKEPSNSLNKMFSFGSSLY